MSEKGSAKPDPSDRCANCGSPRAQHYAVNYADGPHVSGVTLVCPRNTFQRLDPENG